MELTGVATVASGTDGSRRIDRDDLRVPVVKIRTLATKQSPPARFLRLGDVVLDCGAAGHDHGTRGGRWSWLRRAALSGAFGDEREGEQRRRRGSREREAVEGVEASPWRREGVGEAATAKQEVAGVGARASSTQLLRGEGEEDDWQLGCTVTGRAEAGPATGKWPRYGSFSLSLFLIISVFYYSVNLGLY